MTHAEAPLDVGTGGRRGCLPLLVVAGVLLGLLAAAGLGLRAFLAGPADYPGPGSGTVEIEIAAGDTLTAIGTTLAEADVVASRQAFVDAATAEPAAVSIGPGRYEMLLQMSGAGAVQRLLDPASRITDQVVLPEGLRIGETLAIISEATGIPLAELQAATVDPALGLPPYAGGRAEGYLFPATYQFEPESSALAVLQITVERFNAAAGEIGLVPRAPDVGLTPAEVVTVASLLEAEARPEDFAKVAAVVYNRLEAGMPLQFDSTVNYALDRDTIAVSTEDTKVDSPYNTYRYRGLPPGPINSPGQAALEAALEPADGDWLYFVTVDPATGETKFTADYDEFLQFKAELKANT